MRRLMFHVKHRHEHRTSRRSPWSGPNCQKNLEQRCKDGSPHRPASLHRRRSFVESYRVRALSHPCPHRFGWLRRSVFARFDATEQNGPTISTRGQPTAAGRATPPRLAKHRRASGTKAINPGSRVALSGHPNIARAHPPLHRVMPDAARPVFHSGPSGFYPPDLDPPALLPPDMDRAARRPVGQPPLTLSRPPPPLSGVLSAAALTAARRLEPPNQKGQQTQTVQRPSTQTALPGLTRGPDLDPASARWPEPERAPKPLPEPDLDLELEPESGRTPGPAHNPNPEPESKPQREAKSDREPAPDSEPERGPKSEREPKSDREPAPDSEPECEAGPGFEPAREPGSVAEGPPSTPDAEGPLSEPDAERASAPDAERPPSTPDAGRPVSDRRDERLPEPDEVRSPPEPEFERRPPEPDDERPAPESDLERPLPATDPDADAERSPPEPDGERPRLKPAPDRPPLEAARSRTTSTTVVGGSISPTPQRRIFACPPPSRRNTS